MIQPGEGDCFDSKVPKIHNPFLLGLSTSQRSPGTTFSVSFSSDFQDTGRLTSPALTCVLAIVQEQVQMGGS